MPNEQFLALQVSVLGLALAKALRLGPTCDIE